MGVGKVDSYRWARGWSFFDVVVNDARRHGITMRRVYINHSGTHCTVEGGALRLGFSYVQGIGERVGACDTWGEPQSAPLAGADDAASCG